MPSSLQGRERTPMKPIVDRHHSRVKTLPRRTLRSRSVKHHNARAVASWRDDRRIDIFCTLSGDDAQGGFTIEPSLSPSLADRQLAYGVDVYQSHAPVFGNVTRASFSARG